MLETITDRLRLKSLKEFVKKTLPPKSTVRELILSEPDDMTTEAFTAKVSIWMTLLKKELAQRAAQGSMC